jgi:hypothetical protein
VNSDPWTPATLSSLTALLRISNTLTAISTTASPTFTLTAISKKKTIPCDPSFLVGPSLSLLKLGWDRRPVPQQFKAYAGWVTDSQGLLTVFHLQAIHKTHITNKRTKRT